MTIFKNVSIIFLPVIVCISQISAQEFNYSEVLQKSMWFYEVQRSGKLPENNRVEWRGSSGLDDGSDVGHDLSGGWLDAGDNMKFNFPMASSVTLLAWGGLEYPDGYQKCGQWGYLLSNIKWVTDYFLKCHTSANEFYGQIGIGMTDHKWWGSPEVFPNVRPAFKIDEQNPGSDLAAEAAAALASSSILFRNSDAAYADNLVKHAKELYNFAEKYPGCYHEAITDATDFYKSWSGFQDELVWGAIWLYIATGDEAYLAKAETGYKNLIKEPQSTTPKYKEALSWDDKTYGCYVLLAKITNKELYHTDSQRWLDWWTYGYSVRQTGGSSWSGDQGIAYTPSGLAWIRQWGPIRYAANTAFAALVYSDCQNVPAQKKDVYYKWSKSQIDYALGKNELKRSYVCGFGEKPPVSPHHRSMHGPYLDDNGRTPVVSRHTLYGALVGGPKQDGSFTDDRLDAVNNEVATDYNAGFSSVLARLARDINGTALTDFPKPAIRDTEYTVIAKVNTAGDRFSEISATVQNKTTWPARYSNNLTLKYFVNVSEVLSAGLTLADVIVEYKDCDLCHGELKISQLQQYSNDTSLYFTEISFATESIFPGGQSAYRREVQFRIGLPETAPQNIWDPSNDPSFTGLTNMIDTAGNINMTVYENGLLVWGKEPDGTAFSPPTWKMPTFTEPQFTLSGWNNALFKGASQNSVKPFTLKPSVNSQYKIVQNQNMLSITAKEDLKAGLFSLDGKFLKSISIRKNSTDIIDLSKVAKTSKLLQIACKKSLTRHMIYVW
jgi:hypothetical protein